SRFSFRRVPTRCLCVWVPGLCSGRFLKRATFLRVYPAILFCFPLLLPFAVLAFSRFAFSRFCLRGCLPLLISVLSLSLEGRPSEAVRRVKCLPRCRPWAPLPTSDFRLPTSDFLTSMLLFVTSLS